VRLEAVPGAVPVAVRENEDGRDREDEGERRRDHKAMALGPVLERGAAADRTGNGAAIGCDVEGDRRRREAADRTVHWVHTGRVVVGTPDVVGHDVAAAVDRAVAVAVDVLPEGTDRAVGIHLEDDPVAADREVVAAVHRLAMPFRSERLWIAVTVRVHPVGSELASVAAAEVVPERREREGIADGPLEQHLAVGEWPVQPLVSAVCSCIFGK
jgi:hypothetical protein